MSATVFEHDPTAFADALAAMDEDVDAWERQEREARLSRRPAEPAACEPVLVPDPVAAPAPARRRRGPRAGA